MWKITIAYGIFLQNRHKSLTYSLHKSTSRKSAAGGGGESENGQPSRSKS
jgi:hypothetical protein